MRILMLSGLGLAAAMVIPAPAEAQVRHGSYADQNYRGVNKVEREYRKKFAEEQSECSKKQREADSRGEWLKAQRECRKKLAELDREYRKKSRDERQKSFAGRYDRDDDD